MRRRRPQGAARRRYAGRWSQVTALSESDKERCRYHLGYLNTSFAASLTLGIPRPVQTLFLVEDAMGLLIPQTVPRVICILDTLDGIETMLRKQLGTLGVKRAGELELHPLSDQGKLVTDSLEREYVRWGNRLADILGCPHYPFSARYSKRGPGSSIPVR
jgi:hypothetical protein